MSGSKQFRTSFAQFPTIMMKPAISHLFQPSIDDVPASQLDLVCSQFDMQASELSRSPSILRNLNGLGRLRCLVRSRAKSLAAQGRARAQRAAMRLIRKILFRAGYVVAQRSDYYSFISAVKNSSSSDRCDNKAVPPFGSGNSFTFCEQ